MTCFSCWSKWRSTEASYSLSKVVLRCFGAKSLWKKTKICFSMNVTSSLARSITRNGSSGFTVTKDPGKYLGVPLLLQRVTKQTYSYISERTKQKLASWKSKNLSLAGRITLCKPILSAVPLYPMHSSLLPEAKCNEIEKICRRFIRGEKEGKERPPSQVENSLQVEAGWWARTQKCAHLHLLRGLAGV